MKTSSTKWFEKDNSRTRVNVRLDQALLNSQCYFYGTSSHWSTSPCHKISLSVTCRNYLLLELLPLFSAQTMSGRHVIRNLWNTFSYLQLPRKNSLDAVQARSAYHWGHIPVYGGRRGGFHEVRKRLGGRERKKLRILAYTFPVRLSAMHPSEERESKILYRVTSHLDSYIVLHWIWEFPPTGLALL